MDEEVIKNIMIKNNKIEEMQQILEHQKKQLVDELSKLSLPVLSIAYRYALNYTAYGVDVTEKWETVVQNVSALEKAYRQGYYDALQDQKADAESEDEK